jgi:hypothetical protein
VTCATTVFETVRFGRSRTPPSYKPAGQGPKGARSGEPGNSLAPHPRPTPIPGQDWPLVAVANRGHSAWPTRKRAVAARRRRADGARGAPISLPSGRGVGDAAQQLPAQCGIRRGEQTAHATEQEYATPVLRRGSLVGDPRQSGTSLQVWLTCLGFDVA